MPESKMGDGVMNTPDPLGDGVMKPPDPLGDGIMPGTMKPPGRYNEASGPV